MPLFDYRCPKCHVESEHLVRSADRDLVYCACARHKVPVLMTRLASAPAAITIVGYSAKNGYTMPSEKQPAKLKGIRTTVTGG